MLLIMGARVWQASMRWSRACRNDRSRLGKRRRHRNSNGPEEQAHVRPLLQLQLKQVLCAHLTYPVLRSDLTITTLT